MCRMKRKAPEEVFSRVPNPHIRGASASCTHERPTLTTPIL